MIGQERKHFSLFDTSMKNLAYRLQAVIPSILLLLCVSISAIPVFHSSVLATTEQSLKPAWCRGLPRPEYKMLKRVNIADPWLEVYDVAPNTFALYSHIERTNDRLPDCRNQMGVAI